MAAIRTTSTILLRNAFRTAIILQPKRVSSPLPSFLTHASPGSREFTYNTFRCASTHFGDFGRKASARLSQVQQLMLESEERAKAAANETPPPKICLEHVTVSFATSGGPGGQNVNKVNTKVDMRFNVKNATWLNDRIRDKILMLEKSRINENGEIVISSTKTRSQQGNIQDCLSKLQVILDAAAYVPPPPSEEQKKKIVLLAAKSEQKRLLTKKSLSHKKQSRNRKSGWN